MHAHAHPTCTAHPTLAPFPNCVRTSWAWSLRSTSRSLGHAAAQQRSRPTRPGPCWRSPGASTARRCASFATAEPHPHPRPHAAGAFWHAAALAPVAAALAAAALAAALAAAAAAAAAVTIVAPTARARLRPPPPSPRGSAVALAAALAAARPHTSARPFCQTANGTLYYFSRQLPGGGSERVPVQHVTSHVFKRGGIELLTLGLPVMAVSSIMKHKGLSETIMCQ